MRKLTLILALAMLTGPAFSQSLQEQFAASAAKAEATYPDGAKEGTPFYSALAALDLELKARGHPLFNSANKPLVMCWAVDRLLKRRKAGVPEDARSKALWADIASVTSPAPVAAPKPPATTQPNAPSSILVLPLGGGNYITSDGQAFNINGNLVTPLGD